MQTETLVREAQRGDRRALETLFDRCYPRVARIVSARVGPKLRQMVGVDDLVQEVFLQALLRLERFEPRSDAGFLDWLATIAANQVRKAAVHWSRDKRDPGRLAAAAGHPDDGVTRAVREFTARTTSPLSRAARRESHDALLAALDLLDDAQREAIVLRHFAGMEFEEIAVRLGRPGPAAAREHYRRSRARLAVTLRRLGAAPESEA